MRFEIEWHDAPGVVDRLLAATWARLSIRVGEVEVIDLLASDNRRSSVYGPVLPLVEWLVENWWHLLYEPSPTSPLVRGQGAPPWTDQWNKRHNLLAAREGTALPDAVLARDGDDLVVRWFPDVQPEGPRRVRFVGEGMARVSASTFEAAAAALVGSTLARLNELVRGDDSVQCLAEAWAEIQGAEGEERELGPALARLGVDPYDPAQANDSLVEQVAAINGEFSNEIDIRTDLFEGSPPGLLGAAVEWLRENLAAPTTVRVTPTFPTMQPEWAASAHQTGYRLARRARSELLGLRPNQPIDDLHGIFVDRLGWDVTPVVVSPKDVAIHGLVGLSNESGKPRLVEPGSRTSWAERFLMARAAFFTTTAPMGRGRLLTKAVTRHQRAARAFAAEMLAPASALAEVVSGVVSAEEVSALSDRFGVNPVLIEHQIENHRLGFVAA